MKSFLGRTALFCLLQLTVGAYVLFQGNPSESDHFYCAISDKLARMDEAQQPRLLVAGGSNVAFGVDSRELEMKDRTTINLGMHAGLGLDFYLRLLEEKVRSGDIIVLMLEYELLLGDESEAIQRQALATCPDLNRYLLKPESSWQRWKKTLDREFLHTAHLWTRQAFRWKRQKSSDVYRRSAFNEFGDVTAHVHLPPLPKEEYAPLTTLDETAVSAGIHRMNRFASHCREQGAEVYFAYPPIDDDRFAGSQQALASLYKRLEMALNFPQINRPEDCVFDSDCFFDTFYHLRGDAVAAHSKKLHASLQSRRVAAGSTPAIWR